MTSARVVRLRKKGQLTIPEDIRAAWGMEEDAPLWLSADDGVLTLAMRDPRAPDRVAVSMAEYNSVSVSAVGRAAADWPSSVPPAPRLRDLRAILSIGARLTPEEADAFAEDLAAIRAEADRGQVRDPWAS